LYVAIACSFGISNALTNSGLAEVLANFLITVGEGSGLGGESSDMNILFDRLRIVMWLNCIRDVFCLES
jgi:hypothetical protein